MKSLFYLFGVLAFSSVLSSCAHYNGEMTSSASLSNGDFKVLGTITGTSCSNYIFFVGGLDRAGLVKEARKDMYEKANLQTGQVLGNISVDFKRSFFLPFYMRTKVVLTADLIDFNMNRISKSSKRDSAIVSFKPVLENKKEYSNFNLKDSVIVVKSGKCYLGRIEVLNSSSAYVSYVLKSGFAATDKKSLNNVFKTSNAGGLGNKYNCKVGSKIEIHKLEGDVASTIFAVGKVSFLTKVLKENGKEKILELAYDSPSYELVSK